MRDTRNSPALQAIPRLTSETEGLIEAVSYPLRYLLKLYQTVLQEREMQEITVEPSKARTDRGKKIIVRELSTSEFGFQELPVNLQLDIFSNLDAKTVCIAGTTCRYWNMLSEDKILWMNLLQRNMQQWKTMGYQSCPQTYMEARSDLTLKQIYLRCSPECRSFRRNRESFKSIFVYNLQNLPFLFSKKRSPRLVMFGPGLESDTKGLVRKLLWDSLSPFQVSGMFRGEFDGIGSGVCLRCENMEMNLITLYASNRKEREANARLGKERQSKLLVPVEGSVNDNDEDGAIHQTASELSHPIRELCQTANGFVYVVDSSANTQRVNLGDTELSAMMNGSCRQATVPLLVLSCVPTEGTPSLPCATVVELLQLRRLNRPWQVNAACVDNLDGVLSGFKWLLSTCS